MQLKPKDLYKKATIQAIDTKKNIPFSVLGQNRALNALRFGIRMFHTKGYNIFCAGPKGVGRTSLTIQLVEQLAKDFPKPKDWCYVYNFADPKKPLALSLNAGEGKHFTHTMILVVNLLKKELFKFFNDDSYKSKIATLEKNVQAEKEKYFNALQGEISSPNVSLMRMPSGLVVAPMKNGAVLDSGTFNALPLPERKIILEEMEEAQKKLEKLIKNMPDWDANKEAEIQNLQNGALNAILQNVFYFEKNYAENQPVLDYLKQMKKDIKANLPDILEIIKKEGDSFLVPKNNMVDIFHKYSINLIVDNSLNQGAPVIHLSMPSVANLLGKIERIQVSGSVYSDFSLIKAGALHKANGGFLIIDAKEILENPMLWHILKQSLFKNEISMQMLDNSDVFSLVGLEPLSIPLKVKVILVGDTGLYAKLIYQEDAFADLFKVFAQFEENLIWNKQNEKLYARQILYLAKEKNILPLSIPALNRIIEYSGRLSESKNYLSLYFTHISALMQEANLIALNKKEKAISLNSIQEALNQKQYRLNAPQEEMMRLFKNKILSLTTHGKQIGQMNALVVQQYGLFSFGRPNRVSCQIKMGSGTLIDIEREVLLGGPIHSKGVYILSSYLAGHYAKEKPLSIDASLVFEQSYSELDGDSASLTELCCLLSSIAKVPLNQGIAATGSVNQLGQVQAIGGVNEKIEGYFKVCQLQGLNKQQGVIIPKSNVQNLLLNQEVQEAVQKGYFTIYAVETVEEALAILSGMEIGKYKNGYPKNTFNALVEQTLNDYANKANNNLKKDKK